MIASLPLRAAEQTIPLGPLVLLTLTTAGGALVLIVMGVMGARRRIRPNDFFGIRTAYTRSSEEAWYAVHEASARWTVVAGLLFLPAAILPPLISDPRGQIAAVLVPVGVGTVLLLVGSWRGHRVARRRRP
ncbi:SdpI family protein [Nocardiopsis alba]|uniref:SdpI family protein n=1 Tax=Nocardiopsis alba TaxID=53437 RepID=UPI0033A87D47